MIENLKVIETKTSKVYIGDKCLNQLNQILADFKDQKLFILVDENSMEHCLPKLISQVSGLQDAEIIEIDSGEENKTVDICFQIWKTMAEFKASRNSLLINLGGGVITDMGGFIASTYKRGINFVNIPTTLLSQIDASVGGKVGVDLEGLKNMVGVFNEPLAVLVEPSFLYTLPSDQLRSGLAEALKHALIADKAYWSELKDFDWDDLDAVQGIIESSITIKNTIVLKDPKEKKERKLLNFGHTIGHAIETFNLGSSNELLHGEAVAAGMIMEAFLSQKKCNLPEDDLNEVVKRLIKIFNPTKIDEAHFDSLIGLMKNDKKNNSSEINFTLLSEIGRGVVDCTATEVEIKAAFMYLNDKLNGN